MARKGNCPGSSAKSGLWPRQRPESQFFQRKFAYRPPLRGGTWAPSRGTWAVTLIGDIHDAGVDGAGWLPVLQGLNRLLNSQLSTVWMLDAAQEFRDVHSVQQDHAREYAAHYRR